MVARSQMDRLTEVGMFFQRQGPVWETLRSLEQRLHSAGIDYLIIGGLALDAHNYVRTTTDVDVVLSASGFERFRSLFEGQCYHRRPGAPRRFVDLDFEVQIDVLIAGEIAGRRSENQTVVFPDPSRPEVVARFPTVSLARLIELKLVTWRYKDWGDVVELIRHNQLTESFSEQLDPVVRSAYQQCYDQATDPEYEGPSGP